MTLKEATKILPVDHILDHRGGRYKIYFSHDAYTLGMPYGEQEPNENFVTFMARIAREWDSNAIHNIKR